MKHLLAVVCAMLLHSDLLAEELAPLAKDGFAQLVANGSIIAKSERGQDFGGTVRIFIFPEVVGECWGEIDSCPNWRLVFALTTGDLYDEQKAFELPKAKGWEFVRWLPVLDPESGSFIVKTALPDANVDPNDRKSWSPTYYKVVLTFEKATVEVVPSDV